MRPSRTAQGILASAKGTLLNFQNCAAIFILPCYFAYEGLWGLLWGPSIDFGIIRYRSELRRESEKALGAVAVHAY